MSKLLVELLNQQLGGLLIPSNLQRGDRASRIIDETRVGGSQPRLVPPPKLRGGVMATHRFHTPVLRVQVPAPL